MFRTAAALAAVSCVHAQWTLVAENVGTISTGAAFVSGSVGYLPVVANGVGPAILKTLDGGKTWVDNETSAPFALLLLDIAAHTDLSGKDNVAVIGALSLEYSVDSAVTFNSSIGPLGAGQCIRSIADTVGAFAAVGTWGLINEENGPALSFDKGVTYKAVNITSLVTEARYGAFPTSTSWYITAGQWPETTTTTTTTAADEAEIVDHTLYTPAVAVGSTIVKRQGARMHLLQEPSGTLKWAAVKRGSLHAANPRRPSAGINGYAAQIASTTDGGKTWATVFSDFGDYYFNGIECSTDQDCCAVAEDEGPPYNNASDVGTYIFCTTDGGKTWGDVLRNQNPDASLIDIAALSPLEYWAVGGTMGSIGPKNPTFFHTVDGGKTWTNGTGTAAMDFMYGIAIDCVTGVNCWVNLLDVLTQESSVAILKATS